MVYFMQYRFNLIYLQVLKMRHNEAKNYVRKKNNIMIITCLFLF